MKKRIFALLIILTMIFNASSVLAKEDTSQDWIYQELKDYSNFQDLLKEYPNMVNISNETTYILYETTVDKNGNIIKNIKTSFKNRADMDKYENAKQAEKAESEKQNIGIAVISDGGTEDTYYSSMKLGLALYKFTSTSFFTACAYEWLQIPAPGIISTSKLQAVVGLALNPQLTIDSATYGGRVSYTSDVLWGTQLIHTSTMLNDLNGGITVRGTGAQGIGYSYAVPHYTGYNFEIVTSMSGVISCTAYKSNVYDQYCSILGEIDHVTYTLDLNSFSVSIPLGISFGLATSCSKYTAQGALDIR